MHIVPIYCYGGTDPCNGVRTYPYPTAICNQIELGLEDVMDVIRPGDYLGKDNFLWIVYSENSSVATSLNLKANNLYFIEFKTSATTVIGSIPKAEISQKSVRQKCLLLFSYIGDGNGSGGNDDMETGGLFPFGFSVFDWSSLSLPWWAWAAIAGGAAIGSSSARGKIGTYGWGALAVGAGLNALNKYNESK